MQEVTNIITTLGFPMVACIVIYLDSRKDKERLYNTIDEFGKTLIKFGDKMDNFDNTLKSIDRRLEDLEEVEK